MLSVLNVTGDRTHCGHMGHVVRDFKTMCKLAHKFKFDGVNLNLQTKDKFSLRDKKACLADHNLLPIAFGFTPEIFNPDERVYKDSLKKFKSEVEDAHILGCNTCLAYLPPFSNDLNFNDKFRLVSKRLQELKPFLAENKLKVGFEFIGPTETRRETPHDFIHTIDGTRALIASADLYGIAGCKLDVHHWQYSGATLLDIKHMDLNYILYVELNDSLKGHSLDTIPEFERELPFATGGTDLTGFLQALSAKGYKGPVAVEPWNTVVNAMPLEQAVEAIKKALDRAIYSHKGA